MVIDNIKASTRKRRPALLPNHIIMFPFSTSQLSKFSHSIRSNEISVLSVDGKEQTGNYRLQLFKYCDMRSLDGTKSPCSEWLGYKDWESSRHISEACPHLSTEADTQTQNYCSFCYTLRNALVSPPWEKVAHVCSCCHHFTLSEQSASNMAIRKSEEKHSVYKLCAE